MKSQRQLQIGESIKRQISEIFVREDILTVPGSYITILEADVSPDAKNVKIFIDIFGNEAVHEKILEKLNLNAPYFRFLLAKKVSLRTAPEISFILDKTQSRAMSLESLMEEEAVRYKESEGAMKKSKPAPRKKK